MDILVNNYPEGLISVSEILEAEYSFQDAQLEHLQTICNQKKLP